MRNNTVFFLIFTVYNLFSQELILVTESTIILDVDQTKELYFSFAEGDEIIFNMQMVKGKHIKEIEVVETPGNTILTEFKSTELKDKRIQIRNKGIYKFKFYSSSLTRRVCKIKIFRIPKDENTKTFNTNWKWKVKRDTTYTTYQEDSLVGYQTIKYKETVRELKETKYEEIMLFEKSQRVHSYWNPNPSRTYLRVDLPKINSNSLKEERLVAWSYWIGVGQEGAQAYKENIKSISNLVAKAANIYYQSPLAGVAVGEITNLIIPTTGQDIQYYFIEDFNNVTQFLNQQNFLQFDQGKGVAAFGRSERTNKGTFYIGLYNDNRRLGLDVDVKVLAIKEIKLYENIVYDREKEKPQYVTLQKTKMNINETRIRVPVE
ncbi:MAG: hypothetical protein Wins2KO_22380 [Winogradskyella sp.]